MGFIRNGFEHVKEMWTIAAPHLAHGAAIVTLGIVSAEMYSGKQEKAMEQLVKNSTKHLRVAKESKDMIRDIRDSVVDGKVEEKK